MFLSICEILLRTVPIPGVQFNVTKYDSVTGKTRIPNSILTYRNDKGDFVGRKTNQWGYADREHKKEKADNIFRVGFFGDSWTEARQVPLQQTFFHIIGDSLKNSNVECLAFGISGFSTLQSYLNCKRWARFFDIDLVVYVFCENDLGDQIREIKRSANNPYAILAGYDFKIDNTFREIRKKYQIIFRVRDYLTSRSLFFATIYNRLTLLVKYGIKIKVSNEDRFVLSGTQTRARKNEVPNENDNPSSWRDSLREYAKRLEAAILLKWQDDLKRQSKRFVILYVPRSSEIRKEMMNQDSWKPWLGSFCTKQNINLIDPTEELLKMNEVGKQIFYDHFTKYGHIAFANSFIEWFRKSIL